jgi:hypothetical protein
MKDALVVFGAAALVGAAAWVAMRGLNREEERATGPN